MWTDGNAFSVEINASCAAAKIKVTHLGFKPGSAASAHAQALVLRNAGINAAFVAIAGFSDLQLVVQAAANHDLLNGDVVWGFSDGGSLENLIIHFDQWHSQSFVPSQHRKTQLALIQLLQLISKIDVALQAIDRWETVAATWIRGHMSDETRRRCSEWLETNLDSGRPTGVTWYNRNSI